MGIAVVRKIIIDQGATWRLPVQWVDDDGAGINMAGYTLRAQIRTNYAARGGNLLADLTLGAGIEYTDQANGEFALSISAAATRTMPIGSFRWDVEAESGGGEVTRLLMGPVDVRGEVTR
jgi:hypothetical protein